MQAIFLLLRRGRCWRGLDLKFGGLADLYVAIQQHILRVLRR
jgi:hypothetical protein